MEKEQGAAQELLSKMPGSTGSAQADMVKEGIALVRLENETQMQISVQRPRNEVKILSDALKELDTYPSMADEVMYRKPVGKDDNNVMKYAEGLSIRAAESLANRWTNSAYGVETVSEDADSIVLSAVFLDYENNTRHVMQKRVSKFYKARDGKKIQHPPDRFADVVVPANQSKLLREIINRSLPAGLRKEYEDRARSIMVSGDAKKMSTKLIAAFIRIGVAKSKLEELAGKKVEDLTKEEITDLIAVGNAIRDGETTIEQMIIERTSGEKLADRLKTAGDQKQPETPSGAGLTGARLEIYTKAAEMAAGDMLEQNKILLKLSNGKVADKQTLIDASEDTIKEITTKMFGGKK